MSRRILLTLIVALATLSAACSKDKDDPTAAPRATTTTTVAGAPTLTWKMEGLDANGTQPPNDAVLTEVKATLDGYLAQAVVAPLSSGEPAGDLSAVLSVAAIERLAADPAARATLIDEGMPPATEAIETELANATLSSVAGPDAAPALIAARIDLIVHAIGPGLDVRIVRNGELVLSLEQSGWRIDSFLVRAQRDTNP